MNEKQLNHLADTLLLAVLGAIDPQHERLIWLQTSSVRKKAARLAAKMVILEALKINNAQLRRALLKGEKK